MSVLQDRVRASLHAPRRWHVAEFAFWILALASFWLFPRNLLLMNEVAILGLFALSLDLILGFAGIVSLGHAAFLGLGAYAAGLLSKYGIGDPLIGLVLSMIIAGAAGLIASPLVVKGNDLTRLMVTLGVALILHEAANSWASLTGGADGLQGVNISPVLGMFSFDLFGKTAYLYSLSVLFVLFVLARRMVHSPFGLSLRAVRDNPLRAAASGVPPSKRLAAIYTISAAYAGAAGALIAQTTQFVSLDVLDFHRSADVMLVLIIGGPGYLYGGLIGALAFKFLQDTIATYTPEYWMFWIGLFLVLFVLRGREWIHGGITMIMARMPGLDARSRS